MVEYKLLKEIYLEDKLENRTPEPFMQDGVINAGMIVLDMYQYHDYEICYNRLKESVDGFNEKLAIIDNINYMMFDPIAPLDTMFMKQEQERIYKNALFMANMYLEDIHYYTMVSHKMIYGGYIEIPTGNNVGKPLCQYLTKQYKKVKTWLEKK